MDSQYDSASDASADTSELMPKLLGPWVLIWRKFKHHRIAYISLWVVGLIYVMALFGEFLTTSDINKTDVRAPFAHANGCRFFLMLMKALVRTHSTLASTRPGSRALRDIRGKDIAMIFQFFLRTCVQRLVAELNAVPYPCRRVSRATISSSSISPVGIKPAVRYIGSGEPIPGTHDTMSDSLPQASACPMTI